MPANEVEAYTRLAAVYDEIVVDHCYPQWADFLDELWSSDDEAVAKVLDVCCGTGLMAAELVARSYEVQGIDSSASMLTRASGLLGPDVALAQAVLPSLGTDAIFDAAISTFDGLNYLTPQDFKRSIAAIGSRLRPGGWLVFDLHTDAMMEFTLANPAVTGDSEGNQFVIRSVVDPVARTCTTTIEVGVARTGEPFTEQHHQYFHTAKQVASDLAEAGFVDLRVTNEYTYEPVNPGSLRATWIARKR